jgi:hypothetical protein
MEFNQAPSLDEESIIDLYLYNKSSQLYPQKIDKDLQKLAQKTVSHYYDFSEEVISKINVNKPQSIKFNIRMSMAEKI